MLRLITFSSLGSISLKVLFFRRWVEGEKRDGIYVSSSKRLSHLLKRIPRSMTDIAQPIFIFDSNNKDEFSEMV